MRIGIDMPFTDAEGVPLDAAGVGEGARMVEDAGLDGIWIEDSMAPGHWHPDALQLLLAAASTTARLELGTAVYLLPIRNPVDIAHRVLTFQALSNDRLTLGVGVGDRPEAYESLDADYSDRFGTLYRDAEIIRALGRGETVGDANLMPWEKVKNSPRIALGAGRNANALRLAATEYDGWICSAGHTSLNTMKAELGRYRELGGKRAIVATIFTDLEDPRAEEFDADGRFDLRCPPEEAARRLRLLADLGFDDALLVLSGGAGGRHGKGSGCSFEDLRRIRGLVEPDARPRPWRV